MKKNKVMIKICGVSDVATAVKAVEMGATWIGLVHHPASKRFVTLPVMQEIAAAVIKAGGKPVLVCVNANADAILTVCQQTGISVVQLHGSTARQTHHLLPDTLTRIYVLTVDEEGNMGFDQDKFGQDNGLRYLQKNRDYLLFDSQRAGSGQSFAWTRFKLPTDLQSLELPYFVAGGLTPQNVQLALQTLSPAGVDVSSGVESEPGVKDLKLIHDFITQVHNK